MPVYEFECPECGLKFDEYTITTDELEKIRKSIHCPKCNALADYIITNRGALRDKPTWLDDTSEQLIETNERPFENRRDHKDFLKKHGFEEKCGYGPVLVSV